MDIQAREELPQLRRPHTKELGVLARDLLRVPLRLLVHMQLSVPQALDPLRQPRFLMESGCHFVDDIGATAVLQKDGTDRLKLTPEFGTFCGA